MNSKKLFIHIPKNAGLTVRRFLRNKIEVCNENAFVSDSYKNRLTKTMSAAGEHHGYEHARWRDVSLNLTSSLDAFAVIRNPWTKVASRYMYGRRAVEKGAVDESYIPDTFEGFLDQRDEFKDKEFYWHRAVRGWYPQLDHVTDEKGNIKCDILRFESFEQDLRRYFSLPKDQKINSSNNFHRGNKDPKWAKWDIDYKTLYNASTIQLVADWYEEDIKAFGFDYDTTATKNIWMDE